MRPKGAGFDLNVRQFSFATGRSLFLAPFMTQHGRYSVFQDSIRIELDGGVAQGKFVRAGDALVLPSPRGSGESRFARY